MNWHPFIEKNICWYPFIEHLIQFLERSGRRPHLSQEIFREALEHHPDIKEQYEQAVKHGGDMWTAVKPGINLR